MFSLRYSLQKTVREIIKQDKRFKGHSKWQNIKHTKAERDQERSQMFLKLTNRMKIAIAEHGSPKPFENSKLAAIIEEAKSKNMPVATINSFLEKMQKNKCQTDILDFRGPGNAIFLMRIISDTMKKTKNDFQTVYRKNNCEGGNGKLLTAFNHTGFIITEIKDNIDVATEDAINVGAEEVKEIQNGSYYEFICDPKMVPKVKQQLQQLNYKIVTADEEFTPRAMITLSEADLEKVETLCAKLNGLPEVMHIYHNIELPEEEEQSAVKSKG